jgi:23S rRNA A2030 N6-methylase RlmJ
MDYDHRRNAGNEGDCVKHPALIAALDETLSRLNGNGVFYYLDLFAGYARYPEVMGKVMIRSAIDTPASVKSWFEMWHDTGSYPGSSAIAVQRCQNAGKPVKLELYDTSEEVRRDLEKTFPGSYLGQSIDLIGYKDHVEEADFVFVDPPGWSSAQHRYYPKWHDYFECYLPQRMSCHELRFLS